MAWVVVPNLNEALEQLNARFPNRDKASDGSIGDASHQARQSSHNPDRTGNPEWRDGDSKDEVRARDFDADLRDPNVTMEDVVQLWVKLARAGILWWVRYIIYKGRIWHKSDNFQTRVYTGSNRHDHHVHVNSDYTQAADEVRGTNWHLDELFPAKAKKSVAQLAKEVIRGDWGNGEERKRRLTAAGYDYNAVQAEVNRLLNTKPSTPSPAPKPSHPTLKRGSTGEAVKNLQRFLVNVFPAYRHWVLVKPRVLLAVDGVFGPQTEAWVKEFQKRAGLKVDGIVGPQTVAALRRYGYKY